MAEVVLDSDQQKMRRQQPGWKEVTLNLTAPGRLVHSESHPKGMTAEKSADNSSKLNLPKETTVRVKRPVSLPSRLKEVANQVRSLGNRTSSVGAADIINTHSSTTSLDTTYKDIDSGSDEYQTAEFDKIQDTIPKQTDMSTEQKQLPKKSGKKKKHVIMSVENRINSWTEEFKLAIEQDTKNNEKEALERYTSLNRRITREAIYSFEQLSCDQQKILSQIMTRLDQRTQALKLKAHMAHPDSINNLQGITPLASSNLRNTPDKTYENLQNSLELFETIKMMCSKDKVPVILVYRERQVRKAHRDEEKGRSNKVKFPREKRDFLELLGVPGQMITLQGFDYSVKPGSTICIDDEVKPPNMFERPPSNHFEKELKLEEENSEATELLLDGRNSKSTIVKSASKQFGYISSYTDNKPIQEKEKPLDKPCEKPHEKPHEKNPNRTKAKKKTKKKKKKKNKNQDEEEIIDLHDELRSILSCDTCSSNNNSEDELIEADEEPIETDDADAVSYTIGQLHRETLQPPAIQQLPNQTYLSFAMEKIGLHSTVKLCCPFLRMSLRDASGCLLKNIEMQQTMEWEKINKHYLRGPGHIYLQQPLEELPDDTSLFFELRHYNTEKCTINTVNYTFLEMEDLRKGDGEYICELYKPPVDYTKTIHIPYSEKAFFLHFEIKTDKSVDDNEE